jgi:hypothetical protein
MKRNSKIIDADQIKELDGLGFEQSTEYQEKSRFSKVLCFLILQINTQFGYGTTTVLMSSDWPFRLNDGTKWLLSVKMKEMMMTRTKLLIPRPLILETKRREFRIGHSCSRPSQATTRGKGNWMDVNVDLLGS